MLDQSRFLAMKNLAKDVRKEKKEEFKKFENEPLEQAIKDKEKFISNVINDMETSFSSGEEGKEERQIFKANLLIPDDVDFFQSYSKDKNVRNLMNKYAVNVEDVMSKITELNLYSKYIDVFNEEVKEQEEEDDFVDSMVDLSKNEADDLLNEIEDLSLPDEEYKHEDETLSMEEDTKANEEPEVFDELENFERIEKPKKKDKPDKSEKVEDASDEKASNDEGEVVDIEIEEETPAASPDVEISDEIENISSAVSEFVDEYSKVKRELEFTQAKVDKFNVEKEEIRKKYNMAKDENEVLAKENDGLRNDIERFYQQTRKLSDEKISLQNKLDEATSEIRKAIGEKVQIQEELDKIIYEAEKLASENDALRAKMNSMEETVKQSTNLLKEIYKTIPKKRFNVK